MSEYRFYRVFRLLIMALLMMMLLSVPVHAKTKLKRLKPNKNYKTYDFTGDGKADRFFFNTKSGKVRLNGKYHSLSAAIKAAGSKVVLHYYSLNKKDTFLLVTYPYKSGQRVIGYRYSGGKFKVASEPLRSCKYARVGGLSGNKLKIISRIADETDTLSFQYVKSFKQLEFTELFKVNKKHKIVRASKYASFVKQKDYIYGSRNPLHLSTSAVKWNRKGPMLEYGQKVRLGRVYFSYSGNDAYTGKRFYEVRANGKKGWVKESSAALFVDFELPSFDTIDFYDTVLTKGGRVEGKSPIEVFADKIGATLVQEKTYDQEFNEYTEEESIDISGFHYKTSDVSDDYGSFGGTTVENTGNEQISLAGVAIGMPVDEVRFVLGSRNFSYSQDGKTIYVVIAAETDPNDDSDELIPYETLVVNLSGEKTVSSYGYHYSYDSRD